MPKFDRTGPRGRGPRTGRGVGYCPVGWRGEPQRHSLAAHGIRTTDRSRVKSSVRVDIHGMNVSRWRCPECYRGLKDGTTCPVHGRTFRGEAVDILKDPRAQDYAIYYRAKRELSENPNLSIGQLAKGIGINELIFREHMEHIDLYDDRTYRESYLKDFGFRASGRPIVLGIKGQGSFDGEVEISLEGAEELLPLLQSRGVRMQALSAFNSTSGTQRIEGRIKGVDVDLKVTHPGKDLYHVEGDMYYHIDRTFTRKELKGFYNKVKELM